MAMLAEPRKRKSFALSPRGKPLFEDENRFGSKMLMKMGWTKGKGLGANENGALEFIKVRVKNNADGLGYEQKDDQWTEHEKHFSNILQSLNGSENNSDNNNEADEEFSTKGFGFSGTSDPQPKKTKFKEKISGESLEEKSMKSRARVHYKKFTRGKDLTRYSEKDLANIFGKKALDENEEQPQDTSPDALYKKMNGFIADKDKEKNSDDEDNFAGVTTVKQPLSMNDYFKQKMEAMKNKKNQIHLEETLPPSPLEDSSDTPLKKKKKKSKKEEQEKEEENSLEVLDQESSKRKKKKKDKEKETPQEELSLGETLEKSKKKIKKIDNEKEEAGEDVFVTEDEPKKKKKYSNAEVLQEDSLVSEEPPKKKKRKNKSEEDLSPEIEEDSTNALESSKQKNKVLVEETPSEEHEKKKKKKKNKYEEVLAQELETPVESPKKNSKVSEEETSSEALPLKEEEEEILPSEEPQKMKKKKKNKSEEDLVQECEITESSKKKSKVTEKETLLSEEPQKKKKKKNKSTENVVPETLAQADSLEEDPPKKKKKDLDLGQQDSSVLEDGNIPDFEKSKKKKKKSKKSVEEEIQETESMNESEKKKSKKTEVSEEPSNEEAAKLKEKSSLPPQDAPFEGSDYDSDDEVSGSKFKIPDSLEQCEEIVRSYNTFSVRESASIKFATLCLEKLGEHCNIANIPGYSYDENISLNVIKDTRKNIYTQLAAKAKEQELRKVAKRRYKKIQKIKKELKEKVEERRTAEQDAPEEEQNKRRFHFKRKHIPRRQRRSVFTGIY